MAWRSTAIFEPMLYLLAFGIGIGQLVGDVGAGDSLTYAAFVAPACSPRPS